MIRARIIGFVVTAALVGGAVLVLSGGSSNGNYRVGAMFDTARGIARGSVVKIAGATVGEVSDVRLTSDDQAVVEMDVQRRFAPFRADATCAVRPEGLIGVRSIDCDPGTVAQPLAKRDGLATVGLQHTQVPVDITDFFSIWAAPTRDRLRLLLNTLGMGLAGRGDDLNALLLRSAPALRKARSVLSILDEQRYAIADLVGRSDTVLTALAEHRRGLRGTIRAAAALFRDTAVHHVALQTSLHGLPGTLGRVRTAARQLSSLTAAATPVLADLRRAAPATVALLDRAPGFAADAKPALRSLAPTLDAAGRTLVDARPLARRLNSFTADADPAGRMLATLTADARDKGVVEGLLHLTYLGSALGSRFDALSHLFPSSPVANGCLYAATPSAGCDSRYDKTYAAAKRKKARRPAKTPQHGATPQPATGSTPEPAAPALHLPRLPLPPTVDNAVHDLLDFLLG